MFYMDDVMNFIFLLIAIAILLMLVAIYEQLKKGD